MGLLGRGRGLARGRGSVPWWQGRGRGGVAAGGSMSLDKRPKSLEVRGFQLEDLEEVKAHFAVGAVSLCATHAVFHRKRIESRKFNHLHSAVY